MLKNLIAILLLLSIFTSCKKKALSKIDGDWKLIPLNEYFIDKDVTWNFTDGNLTITEISTDTSITENSKYELKVTAAGKKYLTISERKKNNGKYLILTLHKNVLKLERVEKEDGETAGAFLWYEFVKP